MTKSLYIIYRYIFFKNIVSRHKTIDPNILIKKKSYTMYSVTVLTVLQVPPPYVYAKRSVSRSSSVIFSACQLTEFYIKLTHFKTKKR